MFTANVHNSPLGEHYFPTKEFILEIELNGRLRFDDLLSEIYHTFGIVYRILSANIEYYGEKNLGSVQLLIQANHEQNQNLEYFLNRKGILNISVENFSKRSAV